MKTKDISETAEYIVFMLDKMMRTSDKKSFYSEEKQQIQQPKNYCEVVNKVKKKNIRPDNIGEIILSQIPGISIIIANALLQTFSSLKQLTNKLENDKDILNEFTYTTTQGKQRKLPKNVISNLFLYLKI